MPEPDASFLVSVPTLDELAKDASRAAGLPVEVLAALASIAQSAQNNITTQLALLARQPAPREDDHLLAVDEAARILRVPVDWLYRNGKRLGLAVKLGDGTLRFSHAAIQAAIRECTISPFPQRKKAQRKQPIPHTASAAT
jgi:hypothetical protein